MENRATPIGATPIVEEFTQNCIFVVEIEPQILSLYKPRFYFFICHFKFFENLGRFYQLG